MVITYNVVDDAAHNAKDCGVSKDVWMQVRGGADAMSLPASLSTRVVVQGVRGVEFVLGDLLRIAGGDEEEADAMVPQSPC